MLSHAKSYCLEDSRDELVFQQVTILSFSYEFRTMKASLRTLKIMKRTS
jgi:hypothetical protein